MPLGGVVGSGTSSRVVYNLETTARDRKCIIYCTVSNLPRSYMYNLCYT